MKVTDGFEYLYSYLIEACCICIELSMELYKNKVLFIIYDMVIFSLQSSSYTTKIPTFLAFQLVKLYLKLKNPQNPSHLRWEDLDVPFVSPGKAWTK